MQPADHVTGLATRGELQAALERMTAVSQPFALAICDVVGLKSVNESRGFSAGDACLRAAAVRLRAAAAGAALVARLGGDELVAVFSGAGAEAAARRTAGVLAAPGDPPLRAAADSRRADETSPALVDRLYATLRRS